jgi:hypothetical protein
MRWLGEDEEREGERTIACELIEVRAGGVLSKTGVVTSEF